ncbi:MAG TPA: hypothetical protein VF463_02915 [Sphingobium sp.]
MTIKSDDGLADAGCKILYEIGSRLIRPKFARDLKQGHECKWIG